MATAEVRTESRRAVRYVIVRAVTRGGDVCLFMTLFWFFGKEWAVQAFFASAVFNYLTDFAGQKLWAFRNERKTRAELLKEFGYYIAVRGGNLLLAAGLWYALRWAGLSEWVAGVLVFIVFWVIVFFFYRWVFISSENSLYPLIQKLSRKR